MARALGGRVVTNLQQAELGPISLYLTEAGQHDPIFGPTPTHFLGQAGHQDIVVALPQHAVLLASSDLVANQAFSFEDKPIYCTQFHPELNRGRLRQRLQAYPQYVERIAGVSLEEFYRNSVDTPDARKILRRFVAEFLG
jgi:GMP synthase (glutamine-hydrolysing)